MELEARYQICHPTLTVAAGVWLVILTLQLLIKFRVFKLLLALWASNTNLAGPEGQHKISSWPKGPAKDLEQPEAAHDLLWPEATTS